MNQIALIGVTVLGAVACMAWLFMKWGESMLQKQQANIADQASGTLADMFIFIDPQKMFRYNLMAMFVVRMART